MPFVAALIVWMFGIDIAKKLGSIFKWIFGIDLAKKLSAFRVSSVRWVQDIRSGKRSARKELNYGLRPQHQGGGEGRAMSTSQGVSSGIV
jgi:hypothetical protein